MESQQRIPHSKISFAGLNWSAGVSTGLALLMWSHDAPVLAFLLVGAAAGCLGMAYTGYWDELEVR